MKAEINKDIELVQILLYLSEQQDKTIQCINNKTYTAAISKWFTPHKNHPAVQITKNLICNENFIHIRPLQAILSLDDIIGNPEHPLHVWGTAVTEFRKISDFDAFFESQTDYYRWILDHIASCDFDIEKEYEYQRKAFLFIDRFVKVLWEFEKSTQTFSEFYIGQIEKILVAN